MLAYAIWNWGYRQGTTDLSIGKSVLKFKVVSEKTGQSIGFGLSIVRPLAHIVDSLPFCIGYLFPCGTPSGRLLPTRSWHPCPPSGTAHGSEWCRGLAP